jgi:hypothetical protein
LQRNRCYDLGAFFSLNLELVSRGKQTVMAQSGQKITRLTTAANHFDDVRDGGIATQQKVAVALRRNGVGL